MLLVEGIGRVDRGEEIVVAVELALVTLNVISGVRDQLHLVVLETHTGIDRKENKPTLYLHLHLDEE